MKKFVKIAAIVVAVILAVALIVPFALRGKIADIVKREANEMLAAKLDFEKLDISLLRHFPNASLDLKGLTLVGVDRFEGDTIVAAQRISVVVNLMSLFGDSGFEVTKVILSSPAVHAHKLADGAVNWDVMKPSDEVAEETPAEESSEPSSFRMSVRDFRISDAAIRYEDDSTNMRFSTAPLSLRLRGNMSADRTDLDLRLTAQEMRFVSGGIPLLSGAEAELVAVIDADLANNRFTFSRNTLRLNAISVGLDGWVELDDDAVVMDLTAGCDKVQFKDVLSLIPAFYTREFKNLTAGGELSMALWAKGEMRGSALPAFELKTEVRDGSFQYSSLPKAVTGINIAAKVANPGGVMDKTVVDLSKFGLKMAGNSVSATFYATNLVSDPVFRATAAGRVDLGAVKEVYPLEKGVELGGQITADLKVSGRMSDIEKNRYEKLGAQGTFTVEELGLTLPSLPAVYIRRAAATITPAAMTLGEFGVTVGKSDLAANGQLTGYIGYLLRGDMLSGRLYVKSELLDLNEIMEAMPASSEPAEGEVVAAEPMQAVEVPRNLNLSLNTDLRKVLFGKMTVSDISGEMSVAGGVLSLDRRLRRQGHRFGQLLDGGRSGETRAETQCRHCGRLVPEDFRGAGDGAETRADLRQDRRRLFAGARHAHVARLSDVARPANPHRHGRDQVGQYPCAEYRGVRRAGQGAEQRRPAEDRSQGCHDPFRHPGRPHHHAAFRPETGQRRHQPFGLHRARSDHRLYGQGGHSGWQDAAIYRRGHRRHLLVAQDHARREGGCRRGREEYRR